MGGQLLNFRAPVYPSVETGASATQLCVIVNQLNEGINSLNNPVIASTVLGVVAAPRIIFLPFSSFRLDPVYASLVIACLCSRARMRESVYVCARVCLACFVSAAFEAKFKLIEETFLLPLSPFNDRPKCAYMCVRACVRPGCVCAGYAVCALFARADAITSLLHSRCGESESTGYRHYI